MSLDDAAYFGLIFKMVGKFALPQQGKLILNEKDLARVPGDFDVQLKAALAAIPGAVLSLSNSTCPIDGGFVLDYGGIEENCSFEALFYSSQEAFAGLRSREISVPIRRLDDGETRLYLCGSPDPLQGTFMFQSRHFRAVDGLQNLS